MEYVPAPLTRLERSRSRVAGKALKALAYGADRSYRSLPYHDRRFGSCNYSKMNFDTDPLGSRNQMQGRLEMIPNIALNEHYSWNSKESDWWRDALRKENRCKHANLRTLNAMATESKRMYPADKEPRTVLNTPFPVMGEASLRKIRAGLTGGKPLELQKRQPPRSASVAEGVNWEAVLLAKHGLEFSDESKSKIGLAGKFRRMPRLEEIEALQMTTICHGPHSARMRAAINTKHA